ncbi:MAG: MFS transporter, partial [Solirubrobacteraceae bacterium]
AAEPSLTVRSHLLIMISLFRRPRTRCFFLAHLQSQLGTGAAYVALVLLAYQRVHHSWAIALVLVADVLPGIVLSTPFGALADRLPRTRLAVASQLVSAAAFLGLALVSSFPAIVVLALLAGVGGAMFRPVVAAALPDLVSQDERSAATALYGMMIMIGLTVGPAVTALVLLFGTPVLVMAINAATFVVSAGLLCRVPMSTGKAADREVPQTVWQATREGVGAARRLRGVTTLLLVGAASVFSGAVINVAEPLLATGPLHAGKAGNSLLVAVYGGGMFLASLLCARLGSQVGRLRVVWLAGNALCAAGMLASAAAPSLIWAAATFALTGASNALIVAPEIRLVQELVPDGLRGRVFGFRDTATNAALLAAFVCGGVLLSWSGARAVFAVGGVAVLVLTILATFTFRPQAGPEAIADDRQPALGIMPDRWQGDKLVAGA